MKRGPTGRTTDKITVCAPADFLPFSHRDQPSLHGTLTRGLSESIDPSVTTEWFSGRTISPVETDCEMVWDARWAPSFWGRTKPYYRSSYHLVKRKSDNDKRTLPLVMGVHPQIDTDVLEPLRDRLPGSRTTRTLRVVGGTTGRTGDTLPASIRTLRDGTVDVLFTRGEWAGYWQKHSRIQLAIRSLVADPGETGTADPAVYSVRAAYVPEQEKLGSTLNQFLADPKRRVTRWFREEFGLSVDRDPETSDSSPSKPGGSAVPVERSRAVLKAGKKLYRSMNCYACHGYGGGGKIGPSLVDSTWVYGGSPPEIFTSIKQGRPGGMPGFAQHMNDDQIWKLTLYVRSLDEQ